MCGCTGGRLAWIAASFEESMERFPARTGRPADLDGLEFDAVDPLVRPPAHRAEMGSGRDVSNGFCQWLDVFCVQVDHP